MNKGIYTPKEQMDDTESSSLCEALDRILNKGAVVVGEVTISVANVDLIYLSLQLFLTSIQTGRNLTGKPLARGAFK